MDSFDFLGKRVRFREETGNVVEHNMPGGERRGGNLVLTGSEEIVVQIDVLIGTHPRWITIPEKDFGEVEILDS